MKVEAEKEMIDFLDSAPALVTPNRFKFKSLSNWSVNIATGCGHACRFCYVPGTSTRKQERFLAQYGVSDPDEQWGEYVLLRRWDERAFLKSLADAETTPLSELKRDGNRAVILCSTTDPYQVSHHPDPKRSKELGAAARAMVRRALELIRDHSTLNVRILTRSPLARTDFDLYKTLGNRLLFGMSLPTSRADLSKIYEPKAPAPSQRLGTLRAAREAGLNVFVAMAPTYPECDEADLRKTLSEIRDLDPVTVFHEPINIRAENVARIAAHARACGVSLKTEVFSTSERWQDYALGALRTVESLATELGLGDRLHLWPDATFGTKKAIAEAGADGAARQAWLNRWWNRISEWPGYKPALPSSAQPLQVMNGPIELEMKLIKHRRDSEPPRKLHDDGFVEEMKAAVIEEAATEERTGLKKEDHELLNKLEEIVRRGLSASVHASMALHKIKTHDDGVLWRGRFKSFEDYCAVRWSYKKAHAYRLLAAGEFVNTLESVMSSGGGQPSKKPWFPRSEGQIREILRLPPDHRVDAWRTVVSQTSADELTAKAVAKAARQYAKAKGISPRNAKSKRSSPKTKFSRLLARLRTAVEGTEWEGKTSRHLNALEKLFRR